MLCARVIRGKKLHRKRRDAALGQRLRARGTNQRFREAHDGLGVANEIQVGDSDLARGTGHPNLEHDPGLREQRGAVAGDPGTLLFVRRVGAPRRFTGAVSTITSRPAFVSTDTDAGTIATRRSP